ncbi:MAG: phosphoribosylanthranilate isomerase [Planctomycetota bacterium]
MASPLIKKLRHRTTDAGGVWVKACGYRAPADVIAAAGHVDAIGLNFFARSPRYVSDEAAIEIAEAAAGRVATVGVFVNDPPEAVVTRAGRVGLDAVQFHGDETAAEIAAFKRALPDVAVIRAFRMGNDGVGPLSRELAALADADATPDAVLVDARVDGVFGGTGKTVAWDVLAADYRRDAWPPLILAGGLTAENIGEAIAAVRPWGVDTAGGVESETAVKDVGLTRRFSDAAAEACRASGIG